MSRNLLSWLLLFVLAAIGAVYGYALLPSWPSLRVWGWDSLAWMLLGLPFLWWQQRAGLPDFWAPEVPHRQRFGWPLLIGIGFGLLDVLVWKVILHPEPYPSLPPFLQPFPYSLFLYTAGAWEIELFYRLIPLTLILWLGSTWQEGRHRQAFVWAAILLTSLREPLEQLPSAESWLVLYSLLSGFAMNAIQAWFFVRAGFLASLSLRLGHYLLWHILLGIWVEWVELAG